MYLTKKKNNGIDYLYLMESVHVPGKRYCKKVLIKSYGRWEKLDEATKRKYLDPKTKKELEKKLEQERRLNELTQAERFIEVQSSDISSEQNSNFNKAQALCYGHVPLKMIWDKELGLKKKIDNLQSYHTEISNWSLNDVIFYLCSLKVISPSSYLGASNGKNNFLYCPWQNVTQDNFYRTLDFVYEFKDKLVKHAVKHHLQQQGEDVKVAFFDCTNTYFETPYDDITWQTIHFSERKYDEMKKLGMADEEIEKYLHSDEYAAELKAELEKLSGDVLRMRGPSKESRFSQPIVTVALAINQSGFPIDCEVYAGNTSELKTIKPMLESLKQKYTVNDVYFVADRGLNSTESLNAIKEEKLGFVVAQKVSKQKASERQEMLDLNGYQNCTVNNEGELIVDEKGQDGSVSQNDFRFKVCEHEKNAYVPNLDPNAKTKRKKISVKCKIIYTFSPKRRERELKELEAQISKAKAAVTDQSLMGNPYSNGWRSLVQTQKEAAKRKFDKDQYRAVGLKEEVIADRKATAGYAAVVYDEPTDGSAGSISAQEVLKLYHRLVHIEDCFRVMKSTFSIRPVYVRLPERITAHCYLCVLALMLMRCVQTALEKEKISMSSTRVSKALRQALVVPIPSKQGNTPTFLNVGTDLLGQCTQQLKTDRRQSALDETVDQEKIWEKYQDERESQPDDLDQILRSVNLKPLKLFNSLSEIKSRLNLKACTDKVMLSYEHTMLMQKLSTMM